MAASRSELANTKVQVRFNDADSKIINNERLIEE
jgi:hypothetical protein